MRLLLPLTMLAGLAPSPWVFASDPASSTPPANAPALAPARAPARAPVPAKPTRELDADLAARVLTITPESLMKIVKALPIKRSPTPTDAHRQGLIQARTLLADLATKLGYQPRIEPVAWKKREPRKPVEAPAEATPAAPPAPATPPADPATPNFGNVIFEIKGASRPRDIILVGAHFDAVPQSPGADDNASGVAGLMEIARVLRAHAPARTIRFVLFDLEEIGLVGSVQHLERWNETQATLQPSERENYVFMLSLDGIGYYDERPNTQKNPFEGVPGLPKVGTAGDFIAIATIARHSKVARRFDEAMRAGAPGLKTVVIDQFPIAPPDLLRSDHAPFLLQGHPAAIIADSANFRNPHYHQPTDTPDTLNPPFFARTVHGLAHAIATLADETPPVPAQFKPVTPSPTPSAPADLPAPGSVPQK